VTCPRIRMFVTTTLAEVCQGMSATAHCGSGKRLRRSPLLRCIKLFPGGMFSIVLDGGKAAAFDFLRHITIGPNAVSLGCVETLACHPNSTTHSGFTQEQFAATGMSEGAGAYLRGHRGLTRPAGRL
jgi:hypothetical protein